MTAQQYDKDPVRLRQCVHCQRTCGTLAGGFARIGGDPVCSEPSERGRPDCDRLIMVKFHPLHNCPECMDNQLTDRPESRRSRGYLGMWAL